MPLLLHICFCLFWLPWNGQKKEPAGLNVLNSTNLTLNYDVNQDTKRWVRHQTLWWFRLKDLSIDGTVGPWCFGCFRAHRGLPVGLFLLRYSVLFTIDSISLLFFLVISWFICSRRGCIDKLGVLMPTKYLCVLIYIWIKDGWGCFCCCWLFVYCYSHCGSLSLFYVLLYVTLCPFQYCNHLDGKERADCFA